MNPNRIITDNPNEKIGLALRASLALLPVFSIIVQISLGSVQGTTELLFQHYTITYVDLLFIPFNFYVAKDIDWRRGFSIYVLSAIAVVLNIVAHAQWQQAGVDNGHMIGNDKIIHLAGWAHVAYSIIQMTLAGAFLFLRAPSRRRYTPSTVFAALYFLAAAVSGWLMHKGFILTDVLMTLTGMTIVFVGPWLMPALKPAVDRQS